MRVKTTITDIMDDGVSRRVRFGDIVFESGTLVLTDCKRQYFLRTAILKTIVGNAFVFMGLSSNVSGTCKAFVESEWCVEVVQENNPEADNIASALIKASLS